MGSDYTREERLAAAARLATTIARRHEAQLAAGVHPFIGVPPGPEASVEVMAVFWAGYLGHLVGHLSSGAGADLTAGILKQVLAARHGVARDH